MLVLTRRKDERIVITAGDSLIVVEVCLISASKTRLGFRAPAEVNILRSELQGRPRLSEPGVSEPGSDRTNSHGQLVLTRRVDESIILETAAGSIELTVVAVRSDSVRLGIQAAKEIVADRWEIAVQKNPELACLLDTPAVGELKVQG